MRSFLQFAHHDHRPQDTVIVVDSSPSMESSDLEPSRFQAAFEAIRALIDVTKRHYPRDRVGVVTFNSSASILNPLTQARRIKLRRPKRMGGGTNITAGLKAATKLLEHVPPTHHHERGFLGRLSGFLLNDSAEAPEESIATPDRRIILLSDGRHNTGRNPVTAAGRIKESGITIDTIGVGGNPRAHHFDPDKLRAISSTNPNGSPRYCFIGDTADLVRRFEDLAHHLKPLAG